ncbi:MAG: MBL fold metallo-hydrolase [Chloroflexota bacterium]|nr:MBL fold metallo-hydrolase [Chloroflexota bacterium]
MRGVSLDGGEERIADLLEYGGVTLERLPEAGILLRGSRTIYVDPFRLEDYQVFAADIVLVTHGHEGHLSPADLERVCRADTMIVSNEEVVAKLAETNLPAADALPPRGTFRGRGVDVEAVAAYMLEQEAGGANGATAAPRPEIPAHPFADDGLGFVVEMDGVRVYHAGDSGLIPEMRLIENIDIAVLPVAGWSVMSPDEAVTAVQALRPAVAVPVHYGYSWGSAEDAYLFEGMADCRVEVL